ncbi:MAG: Asp-tRNA(Asn)/Glu-tRNA(Gln) amidotransferase subunit GatB [Thermonemataceae bacterium]|nr:Asp-tRNA(Asn)/Glu-tRNA(Gln) amidotransferase subunit GatB [Thermonemataceae bacterium]
MNLSEKYELVIGLEVHAQLRTKAKAFSPEINSYGDLPNTNISVVTLAHPGVLPKANKTTFDYAIRMGLALGSNITRETIFARKNYFYPDLPKGYQITQDKTPICTGGEVLIQVKEENNREKIIHLTRMHLEEDAGKSMHIEGEEESFIDLNRAGVPLIEIVSEPELRSPEEAYWYLYEIRKLVRYLDICDGNMEEGSLRCDVNVSVRLRNTEKFGTRVEVKNINSFTNVKRAIEYEFERQTALLEEGKSFPQETRMFDATTGKTYSLRTKESLNDYRYFPEPDLTPVIVDGAWIERIKAEMPALPRQLYDKFTKQYGLSDYDASQLTDDKAMALYFEEACRNTKNQKGVANWLLGAVRAHLNELTMDISEFEVPASHLAGLVNLIDEGKINNNIGKQVFAKMLENPRLTALEIAQAENLVVESNSDELLELIRNVLAKYPDKVLEYKNGKKGLQGLFVGEVMKATNGKADPKLTNQLIMEELNK